MASGTLKYYTTKHREHETSVFFNETTAVVTLGAAGCSANLHLNADDCRALAGLLLDAANGIEALSAPVKVAA